MRIPIKKLSGKVGFVAAVALAAVVGGATTGVVMASIPDSNGNLNTCYRNNGGDLRVIDTATDTCANNETAFNLSQAVNNSSTGFFRVVNGVVDTATLRNVTSYASFGGPGQTSGYCIDTSTDFYMGVWYMIIDTPNSMAFRSQGATASAVVDNYCSGNYDTFITHDYQASAVAWFTK